MTHPILRRNGVVQSKTAASRSPAVRQWLIGLVLLAFFHLVWRLDAKSLWLDEAFSVLRAGLPWPDLLLGRIVVTDGVNAIPTIDQHPFGYFLILGLWTRLVGDAVFLLRFPSAVAGTLMVPALWVFARFFERRGVLPQSTGRWAALLAALSPFVLWYGQETRMYVLWALIAVISTYCLLRWVEAQTQWAQRRWGVAYAATAVFFLLLHFYSVLLVPVHALFLLQHLFRRRPRLALLSALVLSGMAVGVASFAAYHLLTTPSSGTNFVAIDLVVLLPDALNAFSLGLSVDLGRVWALDLVFALVAGMGLVQSARGKDRFRRWGWILPASLLAPIGLIALASLVQAAYMNARHLSLISGIFLVTVAGGLAWLGSIRSWLGYGAAAILLAGMVYSSFNYHTDPLYSKGEIANMGSYLHREIHPGDLLLLNPPELRPLYDYYLPLDLAEETDELAWMGAPLWSDPDAQTKALLEDLRQRHRRIWLVVGDPNNAIDDWLQANAFQIREAGWNSPISWLQLKLYLNQSPILAEPPSLPAQQSLDVVFGDRIRLVGYEIGAPLRAESVTPIALYWQAAQPLERRYKYLLQLVNSDTGAIVAVTEREPYDGYLPAPQWPLDATIVEYTDTLVPPAGQSFHLALQWYDAETFEKLPVTHTGETMAGATVAEDGTTLILPFVRTDSEGAPARGR